VNFQVQAVDAKHNIVALDMEAASEASAAESASRQGLTVLSIQRRGIVPLPLCRGSRFPTTLFSIELISLLEAGMNLVEALQALGHRPQRGERQSVMSGILSAIARGESFSRAIAAFPQHFSPLYIATIKSSERTGNVRDALSRYVAYREEQDRVRKKVLSACIYPAILVVAGFLVLSFLMFYVVPHFARVYEEISSSLPFFSGLLFALGRGIQEHGTAIAVSGMATTVLAAYVGSRAGFRTWLNECIWRIPGVGERMKTYQLARLYRTVGMLLRAGIPAVQAFDMAHGLLSRQLRVPLQRAREEIAQGRSMSSALTAAGFASAVTERMLAVGERSGDMGQMMERIARFHDDDVSRFVDWSTRAFEPVLMALLGIAVGLVVVLMYMPIFELAGGLQ
jgi:general secretion pathway protein F